MEYQNDIGSAQNVNSPKYLMVAHQTAARKEVPKNGNNKAIFDNLNDRNYHVDIDGVRYPRDLFSFEYALNDYVDQ